MVYWPRVFLTYLSIYDSSPGNLNKFQTTNNNIMTGEQKNQKLMTEGIAAKIARKNILELQPYRCARDDYSDGVLLDANENAFGPTSLPTKNLDPYDNSNSLERYPDPYQTALKELYAKYRGHGLTPANIFVGVGSDEAIDLLMRIFCQPAQEEILITPPTYGMYKVCAKVNDVSINSVPLTEDFDLRIPEVRIACDGVAVAVAVASKREVLS
jgi:histidinol-phosphate aminotransferase